MSTEPRGTGAVKWVSTDWLLEYHQDQGLAIVDTQPDVHDYIKAHVPGAVYLPEKTLRSYWQAVPAEWIAPEGAQMLIRRLGLRAAEGPVAVYTGVGLVKGWGDGLEQTMMAYSLVRFGLNNVHVLDGGLNKWLKEGKLTSQVFRKVEDSDFKATVRSELFVAYEEFARIKDNRDVIVLDARPANVYAGEGPWIRNGHIPGSVNLPWKSLLEVADGHGKSGAVETRGGDCPSGNGKGCDQRQDRDLLLWNRARGDERVHSVQVLAWVSEGQAV